MSVVKPLIDMQGISKSYNKNRNKVVVMDRVDLTISRGERCAILGPSGSGKSTLLSLLGLLDQPSAGRYFFGGVDVAEMNSDTRATYRNKHIGFIFQSFNLLPNLSALENVALPLSLIHI